MIIVRYWKTKFILIRGIALVAAGYSTEGSHCAAEMVGKCHLAWIFLRCLSGCQSEDMQNMKWQWVVPYGWGSPPWPAGAPPGRRILAVCQFPKFDHILIKLRCFIFFVLNNPQYPHFPIASEMKTADQFTTRTPPRTHTHAHRYVKFCRKRTGPRPLLCWEALVPSELQGHFCVCYLWLDVRLTPSIHKLDVYVCQRASSRKMFISLLQDEIRKLWCFEISPNNF